MTIKNESSSEAKSLTWKELQKIKFGFDVPFRIKLEDNQVFQAAQVLRIIPGRRLVAFGTWEGKSVVAKLFFDRKHAKRHAQKDAAGVKALMFNKIPTPELYYECMSADKRIHVLIFERIFAAQNLEQVLLDAHDLDAMYPLLESIVDELATHHVLGILQHDLHLKNFLITNNTIYTLDGAEIERSAHPLVKKISMNNLALFLSQLGVGVEHFQEKLFRHYAKMRAWLIEDEDVVEIFHLIKKHSEKRWQRFEKKIFRDCTGFAHINGWFTYGVYDRAYGQPELMAFLRDPDSFVAAESSKILKAGSSSTVIRIMLDGREMVIKRYNMKNFWHRLRRSLRATRALTSWRLAQKLKLFGIATAKPVAFLEKRFLGVRGLSYFVTEYVAGERADEYFFRDIAHADKVEAMVKRIADLLLNLAKLEITHGDLKITNILINELQEPLFIDLDGTAEHASPITLHQAWRKEIKRFLENFQDQPLLREKFKTELK